MRSFTPSLPCYKMPSSDMYPAAAIYDYEGHAREISHNLIKYESCQELPTPSTQ